MRKTTREVRDAEGRVVARARTSVAAHRISRRRDNVGGSVNRAGGCSEVWVVEVGADYEGAYLIEVFDDRIDAEAFAKRALELPDDWEPDAPRDRESTRYSNNWSKWASVRRQAVRRSPGEVDSANRAGRSKPTREEIVREWPPGEAFSLTDLNDSLKRRGYAAITEADADTLGLHPRRRLSRAGRTRNIVVGLTAEDVARYWAFADERR